VDPHGRVKVADFGMAKHITAQSGPLSFKGSPYWMAPEVSMLLQPVCFNVDRRYADALLSCLDFR
jgi:serine/threonine protein kinase